MQEKLFFTPGPSELYPTVAGHMMNALNDKIGAISHRSKQFQEIYQHAASGLKTLLQLPPTFEVLFLASATEVWERALQNCVAESSFHLVNGAFSKKFFEFSGELGYTARQQEVTEGQGFFARDVNVPAGTELIAVTHNETSTGVTTRVEDINQIRDRNPEPLLFVDAVSSLPYPAFDYARIDATYFSVQKCFGLPAGLGVWILNERCIAKAEELMRQGRSIGTYHSIPSLLSKAKVNQTPETPNVLGIYLLGKVVEDFNRIGVETIRRETEQKAALVYNFISSSENFGFAVAEPAHRSLTTIVASTSIPSPEVNKRLEPYKMGVGTGYGKSKEAQIRIANFPTHSPGQMEELVQRLKETVG
jgi:phosphoserine aminotransferase